MKKCRKCHVVKNKTLFYKNAKNKEGIMNTCKDCCRVIDKNYEELKGPVYKAWLSAKDRCYNPRHEFYDRYGGRGINMCEEWINDYDAFLEYIGDRPSGKHSLDRIDNDGNYEHGNVKWSTWTEQARNKNVQKNNTSGRTGVSWRKDKKVWEVKIRANYKRYNIGTFKALEDAIKAREEAELKYWKKHS